MYFTAFFMFCFQETVEHCQDSYMTYLHTVNRTLSKMPSKMQSSPMHKPAVRLATDLLRDCFVRIIFVLTLSVPATESWVN